MGRKAKVLEPEIKKPSKYQQAIFDEILGGGGNLGIQAVAGSGKTTTIVTAVGMLPKTAEIGFSAFNSDIVKELKKRLPNYVHASTMHGMGWHTIHKHYRKPEMKFNKVIDTAYKVIGSKISFPYILTVNKVVDLMRLNMAFDDIGILDLMDKHNIPLPTSRNFIEDCINVLMACIDNRKEFDFTDMVFIPALNDDLIFPKYEYLFIDEAQDLNLAQQMIFKKMMTPKSRFVAVGDVSQAIYGFAGSDTESFQNLMSLPNTKLLPLSICYRCSASIVRHAQRIVPQIESSPDAPEGIDRIGSWEEIQDGDWVVCRNVRPLVILCMKLIMQGKKATIKGNDIGKNIINLLKQTKQSNKKMCYYIIETQIERQEEIMRGYGVKEPEKHASVVEMREILLTIKWIGASCRDVEGIISKLQSIFTDDKTLQGIQMMTIHKSKGLEADRVFFLCPELIPSRFAVKPWQLVQESNLLYVGITRAKNELVFVHDFKIESPIKNEQEYA